MVEKMRRGIDCCGFYSLLFGEKGECSYTDPVNEIKERGSICEYNLPKLEQIAHSSSISEHPFGEWGKEPLSFP